MAKHSFYASELGRLLVDYMEAYSTTLGEVLASNEKRPPGLLPGVIKMNM